ncbi:RNB domain-containing ribonuclease [Acetobacter persici]|nr:RNB domain-containing ribonuclease [Acetobacter persici]
MNSSSAVYSCFTIDSSGSLDLDDAFSVTREEEGWRIRCCIADVSSIERGSPLEAAARKNVVSVYSGDALRKAMLPDEKVAERLSLLPENSGQSVMGVTFLLKLDCSGNAECSDVVVERASLSHRGRFSQKDISKILKDASHSLHVEIKSYYDLAIRLMRQRMSNLGVNVEKRSDVYVDSSGTFRPMRPQDEDVSGYIIVQEIMIATNMVLSIWALRQGVPVLFRNHIERRDQTGDVVSLADMPFTKLHDMGQAFLSATNQGHIALQAPAYGWFTSPLRRFVDFVNQHNIMAYLDGVVVFPYAGGKPMRELAAEIEQHLGSVDDHYKLQMKKRVARILENDKPQGFRHLTDNVLLRVVDEAFKAEVYPKGLLEECARRMKSDNASLRFHHACLAGSPDWQLVAMKDIAMRPVRAVSVVSSIGVNDSVLDVEFHDIPSNPGNGLLGQSVTLLSGPITKIERQGFGRSKAIAKQCAAMRMVVEYYDVPDGVGVASGVASFISQAESSGSQKQANKTPVKKGFLEMPSDGNFKGKMLEFCQKSKVSAPKAVVRKVEEGVNVEHSIELTFSFKEKTLTAQGKGSTIKAAEKIAYKSLIQSLFPEI